MENVIWRERENISVGEYMEPLVTYEDVLAMYGSKRCGHAKLKSYKHLFPVYPSSVLASIIADLMGDGHIQKRKYRFDFTSKDKPELERFGKAVFNLFGVKGKIRPCNTNKYGKTFNYGVNCAAVTKILILAGAPRGEKVRNPFKVPLWILENKECFRAFSRRLFDCECSIWSKHSPGIALEMWKEESLEKDAMHFMNQIRIGLEQHFQIKPSVVFTPNTKCVRKDSILTKPFRFSIKSRDSICKFHKEIGFDSKEKQFKLMEIIGTGASKELGQ